MKAIILGAGPVGLVSAWELLKNGWEVVIYEKNEIAGGMCRTWRWDNFLLDTGPHIFHTPDQKLAEFWEKEFNDLFIRGEFWCKNVRGDNFEEYWDYPLSWESISRYPTNLKRKILDELDNLDLEKKAKAKSYSEYIEFQVGPTLRKLFFTTYPEKVWGISTDQMTPDWAPKRIEFRNKITPFYHNQWNAVGKYGTGCIYDRILEKILQMGGEISFNREVSKIDTAEGEIKRIVFSDGQNQEIEKKDVVISSLPISLTSKLLGLQSDLRFRGIVTVYLAYDCREILPGNIHWLYFGSDDVYFNRITEPKKMSPSVSPENKTYLAVEITFSAGDEIDTMPVDRLTELTAIQVEKTGLIEKDKLLNCCINKERFVYPIYYLGYQEELARTRATISKYQQLYSIGTGGDYNYADSQILFHKAFDTVAIICGKDSNYTQVIRKNAPTKLNSVVTIANREIGEGHRTFIIAEGGLNHNGNLSLGKQLVDAALKAGCDAIKFQSFTASSRISRKVKSVKYAETIIGTQETLYEMFDRLALSVEEQESLFCYAKDRGLEVLSTPFDYESVDDLEKIGVNAYKIASMDLVNLPLIRYVGNTGKPVILSTGMSTLGQIEEAVEAFREVGNKNLILLHCNSSYPSAPEEMNLNMIRNLKNLFRIPVGLSDHTFGLFVSQMAITLGSDVVERHFTLDRTFEGPDHIFSSEPKEMGDLVGIANKIPAVMGDGIKSIRPTEYDTLNSQRKSIYASKNILKGDIIKEEMITIKGPGGGLLPRYLEVVIGRVAQTDIEEDHPITWGNI